MTDLNHLPPELSGEDMPHAVRLVRGYFDPVALWPHFGGAHFERLDGGGDRQEVRNQITGSDIVAVGLLSVDIPKDAVQDLKGASAEISRLLKDIPYDVDLADADVSLISPDSSAWELWELLVGVNGVGWVTANKLLARKRPRLLPVYDNVVRDFLGEPDGYWGELRTALQRDDRALYKRLLDIRDRADVGDDISPLRVFDVICWRLGMKYIAPGE